MLSKECFGLMEVVHVQGHCPGCSEEWVLEADSGRLELMLLWVRFLSFLLLHKFHEIANIVCLVYTIAEAWICPLIS